MPSLSAITNASSASGGGGGLGVCNDDVGKPYQLADVGRIQSDKVHGPRGRKILLIDQVWHWHHCLFSRG